MQFKAIAKYIKRSPFKLRPLADVVRGKSARYALDWLSVYPAKKAGAVRKVIQSAVANAKDREKIEVEQLRVSELKIDQGPAYKYFKPAAMGRSKVLKRRTSHISVTVEKI